MIEDYFSHRHSSSRFLITSVDDSGTQQSVNVTGYDGETFTQVPRQQSFGMSANPPVNAHAHGIAPGGARDRLQVHCGEDPASRPTNTPTGCAVLYDSQGNVIRLYGQNGIQLAATKGNVSVQAEKGKFVYLGGNGEDGNYDFVMTESGPSSVVKAKL